MQDPLPAYDELPLLPGLDVRFAWGVSGDDDAVGSNNLATPERIARAASSVTTGEVIALDLPLTLPSPVRAQVVYASRLRPEPFREPREEGWLREEPFSEPVAPSWV